MSDSSKPEYSKMDAETGKAELGADQERSTASSKERTGWENFWALGWYDQNQKPYLTTWGGERKTVFKLSVDCAPHRIPMWDSPVPAGALLIEVPKDHHELAALQRSRSACIVIGWETAGDFERKPWDAARECPVIAPL